MAFAKIFKNLTACTLILGLASCALAPNTQTTNHEAAKARLSLALGYLEQRDFPKAKENIDKALVHDTESYLPHSVLAYYYQEIADFAQAEQAYQQALKLSEEGRNQPRPDVQNNYGAFLCKQGKFDNAYSQFEQALKSEAPYYRQDDTLENVVICAELQGNISKKAQALTELAKRDPSRAQMWRNPEK